MPGLRVCRTVLCLRKAEGAGESALDNRAVEQVSCERGREQAIDVSGAGGLPEDRDPVRVATKGPYVLLHPFQGRHHVQQLVLQQVVSIELDAGGNLDAVTSTNGIVLTIGTL